MKTTKTLALIGTLGMLAGTVFAQPSPGDNNNQQPPTDRPGAGRGNPELRRKMLIEKYDANKDGKLDDTELAALGKDVLEGKFGPPPGPGRRGPDGQGGPGFKGGPRAQAQGRVDGDRPPVARGQGGPGFEGGRASGPQGDAPQGLRPEGGPEAGIAPKPPLMDRDGGPDRGQFAPGLGDSSGQHREFARKSIEAQRHELIKKYDSDGDGKLSASEREAIGRDIEDGKLPPPFLPPQLARGPKQPLPPE
jgi:hypothetical protein